MNDLAALLAEVRACRVCEAALGFPPRPVVQAGAGARILIVGQAPGSRVHASGVPWDDDSGDRLRGWLGIDHATFYDPEAVALVPMGLCYPGKGQGGDLPPRRECAPLWHARLLARMPNLKLTLLVGRYAQAAYLPRAFRGSMTEAVRRHAEMPAGLFPLPHPAWRSRLWMAKHPWFEAEVLPALQARVADVLRQAPGARQNV
ncbi:MAG: uracil-DNA glycosylase family protein [Novosphingobium sp.]